MATEIASRGNSWEVKALDRAFGGKLTTVLRVSGGGIDTTTGLMEQTGDVLIFTPVGASFKVNGVPVLGATAFILLSHLGNNGAGSVTLAGTNVGDLVVSATNLTTGGDVTSSFESKITVAGAIQQSAATNLSAANILFYVVHQS